MRVLSWPGLCELLRPRGGGVETVAILTDSDTVTAIETGIDDLAEGATFSAEEVRAAMVQAGRLPGEG